jgi:hypothetical protein
MHATLDIRVAAVIPALLEEMPLDDEETRQARSAGSDALQGVVDAAHDAGTLRPDITTGDIGILIIRMSRPLPGPFPHEVNDRLSHRHLDLLVTGLRTRPRRPAKLAGPALTLLDLQHMPAADHPAAAPSSARASRGRR